MSSVIQTILKKKSVFFVLLLVVVGFVFSAQGASAVSWLESEMLGAFFGGLLYALLQFLTFILAQVATITNWAMQPSPITTSSFVEAGFSATRDFANSLFILILLAIALDFILFNSFGVKRALPKLLIIALLINFSVPIAGVVLDFANIITTHFLASVSGKGFTEAIAQSVGIANIFDDGTLHKVINPDAEKIVEGSIFNMFFSIFLLLGMIFTFLALTAMFLIRTGYISVLLILLPIALVLSAFPPTQSHFSKWMSKFMQWTMFAPAATFFLYLSMLLLVETGSKGILSMGGAGMIKDDDPTYVFLRYIMVWGLMLMSLTVAQSMGITGASTAKAMWSKGTKWARGKAYGAAKTGAAAAGRRAKVDEQLEGLAKGLRVIPGLGGALSYGVRGLSAKAKMGIEKHETLSAQQKASFEGMTRDQRKRQEEILKDSHLAGSGAKLAQLQAIQAPKGELNIYNSDGTVNLEATRTRIKDAHENAENNKRDKKTLDAIKYANATIGLEIEKEKWEKDFAKGKLGSVTREEENRVFVAGPDGLTVTSSAITDAINNETGKTYADAIKTFTNLSTEEMKNMQGTWTAESIKTFMEFGGIDANFARKAATIGDRGALTHIEEYLKTMSDDTKRKFLLEKLKRHNPGAISDMRSGRMIRFGITLPTELLSGEGEKVQLKGGGEEELYTTI